MMELLTRVQKAHYSFKEVTSLTGVKPYVLRFWETEFTQITAYASFSLTNVLTHFTHSSAGAQNS